MNWPQGVPQPARDDMVKVMMTEEMARAFEERCLGNHTRGHTYLAGPVHFSEGDSPTYFIGVGESEEPDMESPQKGTRCGWCGGHLRDGECDTCGNRGGLPK